MSINPPPNITEPPTLLTIPYELLREILRIVSQDTPRIVRYTSDNGNQCTMSQMLLLRRVCRSFRFIVPELDFWYEGDFQFLQLFPEFPGSRDWSLSSLWRQDEEEHVLNVLFTDGYLVECLGRWKSEWMFASIEELTSVVQCIPLFKENARSIYLQMDDYAMEEQEKEYLYQQDEGQDPWLRFHESRDSSYRRTADHSDWNNTSKFFYTAADLLSECHRITKFTTRSANSIDLTQIATSFPHLETLNCFETNHFHGTLKHLTHLHTLHLDIWQHDNIGFDGIDRPWLPLSSTQTLTNLTLKCTPDISILLFDTDSQSLSLFTNLKSLDIEPLSPQLVALLHNSTQMRLEIFKFGVLRHLTPIDVIETLLQSPCLQTVNEFGISNCRDECNALTSYRDIQARRQYWMLVFDAFTSMHPSVEQVRLNVPMNIECCAYFARMTKLRTLSWDGFPYPIPGIERMEKGENPVKNITQSLEKAFEGFVEKPHLDVHHRGWTDGDV